MGLSAIFFCFFFNKYLLFWNISGKREEKMHWPFKYLENNLIHYRYLVKQGLAHPIKVKK